MFDRLKQAFARAKDKLGSALSGFFAGAGKDGRTVAESMQRLREKASGLYADAEREIYSELSGYNAHFKTEEAKNRGDAKQYASWKRSTVYAGGGWDAAADSCTLYLYDANAAATRYLNAERDEVYRASYNRTAYEIERLTGQRMAPLRGGSPLSPVRMSATKDEAWNARKISAGAATGISLGESLSDTAKRIANSAAQQNREAFLRNARTYLTGAQNAGRDAAMQAARDLGLAIQKMWIATLDRRTRDAHRELDGQVVNIDEPFTVYGDTIRFPGDPQAKPSLVYNCRCTLGFIYPGHEAPGNRRDNTTGNVIPYMTYREWEKRGGGSGGSSAGRRY